MGLFGCAEVGDRNVRPTPIFIFCGSFWLKTTEKNFSGGLRCLLAV